MTETRRITRIVKAHRQLEGGGFVVRRSFPTRGLEHLDPLLLLDEMGPIDYAPGEAQGAPDHPHRGFETVTYLLAGELEHADSAGHAGTLRPGDVQWMTAGAGVVHREMLSKRIQAEGGRVHAFQLWVNLPRHDKRMVPRYQEIAAQSIPEATSADGLATVKVIAGEVFGVRATIETHTPILYQHWRLEPGADIETPVPADFRLGLYVFEGSVEIAGETVSDGELALLGPGDHLRLSTSTQAQAMLLGGRPLDEPITWGGPFVMNTAAEVREAFADYAAGRMGQIPPAIIRA